MDLPRAFGTNLINKLNIPVNDAVKPKPNRRVLQVKESPPDEYVPEIVRYLRKIETRCRPNYMDYQPELTHRMRRVLVEWLFEVKEEFGLEHATVHRAVAFTDRFLSKQEVPRDKLQLVGTTSLLLSSKIEEISPPTAKEFAQLTDNTYSLPELLRCETLMLKTLKFDLLRPTTLDFTVLFNNPSAFPTQLANMTLLNGHVYLAYKHSEIAEAINTLSHSLANNYVVTTGNALMNSLHSDYTAK